MSLYKGSQLLAGVATNTISNAHSLFDFIWSDHIKNEMSWLRADTFSWQDGSVYVAAYNHLVADYNGGTSQTETVGSYTITYVLADDGHKITTDETTVANIYNESGVAWYYILDTTNTRFKLPRTKYGFTGLRDEVGKYIEAGLPNITGTWKGDYLTYSTAQATGAFEVINGLSYVANGNVGTSKGISFNASRSSSIYGNSTTVQPPATQMYLYFYVGQFTQSATEQTAGLNSELFNNKVDLDAANLSDAGKSLIAGLGMPSDTYDDLTLGASGTEYTAPADGYVMLQKLISSVGQYAGIFAKINNNDYYCVSEFPASVNRARSFLPVKKGQKYTVGYTAGGTTEIFRFIYAVGSESEAS